jgi:hypothetical protein
MSQSGGSDWTLLQQGDIVSAAHRAIFAKIAQGSDTLSVQFEANDFAAITIRIQGHGVSNVSTDIKISTGSGGTSADPDPDNLDTGTSKDYLWLEYFCADDDDNTATYWSTNYTGIAQAESAQSTSSCMCAMAYRQLTASAENPGAMHMTSSEEWAAGTIAIPPAAGGPQTYYKSFAETWQREEALQRKLSMKRSFAETWQAAEAFLQKAKHYVGFAETWQAAESLTTRLVKTLAFAEAWVVSEALVVVGHFYRVFAETWQVAESLITKANFKRAFTETWQASETLIARFVKKIGFAETWQASEQLISRLAKKLTFAESWIAEESLIIAAKFKKVFSDTWQAAENFIASFIPWTPPSEGKGGDRRRRR